MFEILFYRAQALCYRACACFWRGVTALLERLERRHSS